MYTIQSEILATIFTEEQRQAFFEENEELPHIAFVGRSNVGKSSLINALLGRKKLAKVSSTPGKTRSINVYGIRPKPCYLVDLPGYGYAKCSKQEKKAWSGLIHTYLSSRKDFHHSYVVLLIDSRRNPQDNDIELLEYIYELGLPVVPVLTKIDKTNQKERHATIKQWEQHCMSTFLQTSSLNRNGLDNLWTYLFERIFSEE